MKSLSFCILFLSINCLWSQIKLENPEKLWSTIHISSQTPVKDQGNGNSCSAFGVAAALETLPNMPKDISENFLYSSQKYDQLQTKSGVTRGNFLESYIMSLQKYGILTEAELPYPEIIAGQWDDSDPEILKALRESTTGPVSFLAFYKSKARVLRLDSYEYLPRMKSKDVKYIKYLLDNGVKAIPVSYELYIPAWELFSATKYTTIVPDVGYGFLLKNGTMATYSAIKKEYPNINADVNSGKFQLTRTDKRPKAYSAHVVTIVGYDTKGFIIKNSWGTDWRYYGYERVSYDFHELFAYEGLVLKKVSYK
ncbi:C1 family peptidase [Kordia jejudonensis]|uniref:C1 family peptidase n=1 Tax=Kordia jejudonensis TaxID=1348245 RepID=UPI0006298874|nr:C1 family peptidase [Kordia jejudonensis]